jgi:hypothetical protein
MLSWSPYGNGCLGERAEEQKEVGGGEREVGRGRWEGKKGGIEKQMT